MKKLIAVIAIIYAISAWAVIYIWQDEKGYYHITDNPSQLPEAYRALLKENAKQKAFEKGGVGFWRDARGNYHFYKKSFVRKITKRKEQKASEQKKQYNPVLDYSWQGKPNPLVVSARVKKVISGDTILLEGGQKLKYQGICFPEELKGNTKIHQQAIEYQRNLLEGKIVQILFDKRKYDEKGRLVGLVFLGKNVFVNADLVLKGYAMKKTVPPNLEYQRLYQRLENYARKNHLGIWKVLEVQNR